MPLLHSEEKTYLKSMNIIHLSLVCNGFHLIYAGGVCQPGRSAATLWCTDSIKTLHSS